MESTSFLKVKQIIWNGWKTKWGNHKGSDGKGINMKHILEDCRELVASHADIQDFFYCHNIIGRTIADIRPAAFDYMIQNICDIDDVWNQSIESGIETDSQICIIFADGEHMEIKFSGEGPVILGFNTADFSKYPSPDGTCYSLHTLFQHCLGCKIINISFETSDDRMRFPVYRGIDMSLDDEGIKEICFHLCNRTALVASGSFDWFSVEHIADSGDSVKIPFRELLSELNKDTIEEIFSVKKE